MSLKNETPVTIAHYLERTALDLHGGTLSLPDAIRRLADDFAGWQEELDDEEDDWEGEDDDDEEYIP